MKKVVLILALLLLTSFTFSGCAVDNNRQGGTIIGAGAGAAIGAGIGQAIGRNTEGTLIGAAIGTALGAFIGNQIGADMDAQEEEARRLAAYNDAMQVQRNGDVLQVTFQSEYFFAHDSSVVNPNAYPGLQGLAQMMMDYPNTRIRVEGHTDKTGSDSYNLQLSQKRAQAVRDILVQTGVAGSRIQTVGMGSQYPVSSDNALNRRVNILIIPNN